MEVEIDVIYGVWFVMDVYDYGIGLWGVIIWWIDYLVLDYGVIGRGIIDFFDFV